MRRLTAELKDLRESVAGLRDQVSRSAAADDVKAVRDRLAGLSEGVDRLKQTADAKFGQISTQIDKAERQASPAPASVATAVKAEPKAEARTEPKAEPKADVKPVPRPTPAAVQTSTQPKALAELRPPEKVPDVNPRTRPASGWVLRDIYGGLALIEGRRGLVEVEPGQIVAGLGRIERIERRGAQWYVVTERGYIAGYAY